MRRRLRAPVAALLATLVPGLGHAFLGRFGRAVVWHVTVLGGAIALFSLSDAGPIDPSGSIADVAAAVPAGVALPLSVLVGLSAVDAYLVARSEAAEADRAAATEAAIRRHAAEEDEEGDDGRDGRVGSGGVETGDGSGAGGTAVAASVGVDAGGGDPTGVECPHCGRETDAELDFCHWCTEPLPWGDGE
ncbi:zinc ribbon domain-containing protein [Halorubrum aethiopicum]|uniref:zinc ribbon domain-containing protein n=1 Tax=Halorubrum aethiopicum TaxID=1758255 RepID=UPI000829D494|nr:zinc ribbon domain-containing protein [Halorubrum aethiopicum]